jgi:Secretion system C-terminal sorting domain
MYFMPNTRMLVLLFCWSIPILINAQTLSPSLISSAGAHADLFSFGTLDWSVGEPVVTTLTNGDILTQGFHQVFVTVTTAVDEPHLPGDDVTMRIFPNPTAQWVTLESSAPVVLRVFDLRGAELHYVPQAANIQLLDLGRLAAGTYIVEALTEQQQRRTFKLEIIR